MSDICLKKKEQFISSVENREEVIVISEKFLNLADAKISDLKRKLQAFQSMYIYSLEWFTDVEFLKSSAIAKELYNIEKNKGKQILRLKKY